MENLDEKTLNKYRHYNQNLYKIYKMFSWDLLFYYAISFIFLVQTKGLSTSQIIISDAFYPIFKLIFQIPCTILVEKIGKKSSLILGNIFISIYLLLVLGLVSVYGYIISNIFCALGFIIKGIVEHNFLYDSLEKNENKNIIFSKIDGKATSYYYFLDSITSILSGFLFVINSYFPLILSLLCSVLSILLALRFYDISESSKQKKNKNLTPYNQIKFYIVDLKEAFKFISQSQRIRSLIIFYAIFSSLLTLLINLRRSLLLEINVPNEYFGILFAIWGIISAFSSRFSTRLNKKYSNNTLSYLSKIFIFSIIISGLISTLYGMPLFILYFFVFVSISIQYAIKGPFYTLMQQYLGSFSTSSLRTKITSANLLIENIACSVFSFILGFLTSITTSAISTLIVGIFFGILLYLILNYMKSRVGLKPEQYPKNDISFKEL